jgi:hypothetical protein
VALLAWTAASLTRHSLEALKGSEEHATNDNNDNNKETTTTTTTAWRTSLCAYCSALMAPSRRAWLVSYNAMRSLGASTTLGEGRDGLGDLAGWTRSRGFLGVALLGVFALLELLLLLLFALLRAGFPLGEVGLDGGVG